MASEGRIRLDGATVLVTGASQGLGREMAVCFAGRGARLVLAARNRGGLDETAGLARANGAPECVVHEVDLAEVESMRRLAGALREPVDVLVNNAANVTSKPFLETPLDEIAAQVLVNVAGALQLTRLLAPGMVERGRGSVVNISSLAGYKPNTAQTVYSITKSAVNAMSLTLRRELAPHGVHVMNVATPQIGVEPGLLDPARFVAAVAQGIESGTDELFLHRRSKWLMRLYAAFPGLMAWR